MSKKSRAERKARKAAANNEDVQALAQASSDAAALDSSTFQASSTLEEANTRLADASRVINMKEAKMRADAKKGGGAKSGRKPGAAGSGKLPPMPRAAGRKRERPDKPCECGCGGTTKSRFCPGHDSYLRGLALRVYREVMTLDDVRKLAGGEIGKAQAEAVEREIKEMKKAGKLTKAKVAEHATKRLSADGATKRVAKKEDKGEAKNDKEDAAVNE